MFDKSIFKALFPARRRAFFSLLHLCLLGWVWVFVILFHSSITPSLVPSIYVEHVTDTHGSGAGSENATIGLMRSNVNVYLRKLCGSYQRWILRLLQKKGEEEEEKKMPVYFTCMNMIEELCELRNSWFLRVWKTCAIQRKVRGFILKCDL